MHYPVSGTTQSTSGVISLRQAEQRQVNQAPVAGKTAKGTARTLTLPEDIVTLSSSPEGTPPAKKASKPVNNEERKALLHPSSPQNNFSVYG